MAASPLTTFVSQDLIKLVAKSGNAATLERLLDAGVDPETTMPGGETLLMTAARTGDSDTVRVLLARGADPNARESRRGQTALMWAAANNNAAAIHVLAEQGADLHARTDNPSFSPGRTFSSAPATGFTPLLFALRGGHRDAVQVLLDAGADVNDTVSDGQSALVVATANANWELAAYLLDRGADPNHAEAGWNALHQTVHTRRTNVGFGTPGPFAAGTPDSIDPRSTRPTSEIRPPLRTRRPSPDRDAYRRLARDPRTGLKPVSIPGP